jgi:putative transposase
MIILRIYSVKLIHKINILDLHPLVFLMIFSLIHSHRIEERYRLQSQGYDLEKITIQVSSELGIDAEQVWAPGKHPLTVKARSLLCYWAVRKLGITATELSITLGISQPAVSLSVKRGERIANREQIVLEEFEKH